MLKNREPSSPWTAGGNRKKIGRSNKNNAQRALRSVSLSSAILSSGGLHQEPIKLSAREQVQPRPRPEGVLPLAMKEEKMRAGRTTRDDRSDRRR
ncbi:hypothetical protein V6N11_014160 [Hibiscus sabdariffa]|uniref:Uncharacterized protein n=1 Tax=Hibiscus sabdariffa TaxID=183260 RepID=A0ABR2AFU8_9ROSI